jgi:hypothetical protein
MPRKKFVIFKQAFLLFPVLAVLACWPHFGGRWYLSPVLNVESSFSHDMECTETTEQCIECDFFEWAKDKQGEGRARG